MAARGEDLRHVGDFEALCRYLEDTLGWPLGEGEYDFDALTFQYEPEELGLQDQYADAIESIHQLRPVVDGQPWGIFFVRFRKKKLPVGVLRRILSQLALKKRESANRAERAAWRTDDLLFVSAFGEEAGRNREIAFAHFHRHGGDLPTLRVIGWDGNDTPLKLEYLQGVLANKLRWPADPADTDAWRALWRSPFRHRPGHVIRKSDELAHELAKLARTIRDRAQAVMKAESAKGPLTRLYDAFKKSLIHDLTPDGFADTYAQTITYGLLTAAISRTEMSEGRHGTALLASDLADMVPVTNPFLKEMLQTFLEAGGRKSGIDFDELGVQDVVELLRGEDTDLPAILRDFGNKTQGEDPVIHFYEHFLKAYNKALKVQRGVFYTPQPVVSYIVRSVHELLQTEFGLADGLADTTTWGEMLKKNPGLKLPLLSDSPGETQAISPDEPFVQILDPATGTATFLVEVVDVIHKAMGEKWKKQGLSEDKRTEAWNEYVPKHLLPRLHAFELMMAPYAIAHMKIGLKLAETGYRFGTEERARIYLTNALEPWLKQLPLVGFDALAHEAAAVNEIKRHKRFTVVIGNPPYSNFGMLNKNPFILGLLDDYKRGLDEKKLNLDDDFIKFMRFSEHLVSKADAGVLGMITNNVFLDGITHRQMRAHLQSSFSFIRVIDLHGNIKKLEKSPDGSKDENVFDIQQGVGISVMARRAINASHGVEHAELWGLREAKYEALCQRDNAVQPKPLNQVVSPQFFFVPKSLDDVDEYLSSPSLSFLFKFVGQGIQTKQDDFALQPTEDGLVRVVEDVRALSVQELMGRYDLPESTASWSLHWAKRDVSGSQGSAIRVAVKPFESKWTYFTGNSNGFLARPRREATERMLGGNLAIIAKRQSKEMPFSSVFVVNSPINEGIFAIDPKGRESVFPLQSPHESGAELSLFERGSSSNLNSAALPKEYRGEAPESIFHYAYAVLHSPGYRSRYAEFLKIDFPRLPLTGNLELFRVLARLGGELTSLHLLESPRLAQAITEFVGGQNPEVEKVSWSRDTVWIDKAQTAGFHGVREEVWNFHIGGYQVCQKWLKDRKGRTLSKDDIGQYHKIVVALSETIRLMAEIDRIIDQHGGWPRAFAAPDEVS
ncbi:type ISP restriction/modification enzyme [Pseudoxanthomonas sp. Soil82]|uniref:type ISP restriction/modification enzyme n=1 Tax=Pseudoxanthomonas sp. Soil82 TaxID=3157341 RepID=UPI00338E9E44